MNSVNLYQVKSKALIILQVFHTTEVRECSRVIPWCIILISEPHEDTTKRKKYKQISLINTDVKPPVKHWQTEFRTYLKDHTVWLNCFSSRDACLQRWINIIKSINVILVRNGSKEGQSHSHLTRRRNSLSQISCLSWKKKNPWRNKDLKHHNSTEERLGCDKCVPTPDWLGSNLKDFI